METSEKDMALNSQADDTQDAKGTYQCDVCGKQGLSSYQLYDHRRDHDKYTLYQCEQCAMGFASEAALDTHCSTHQQGKCYFCGTTFETEASMKPHHCVNITDKGYECLLCKEGFSHIQQLRKHFVVQHGTSEWTDDGTSEGGGNGILEGSKNRIAVDVGNGFLKDRENRISGDAGSVDELKPVACEVCAAVVYGRSELRIHMMNHANPEELHHKTCGEILQEKCELYKREFSHVCSICKRTFARAGDLNKHEESHQWIRGEIWKFLSRSGIECSVCNLVFIGGVELEEHYHQHVIDDNTYRCLVCLTQFAGEDNVLSLLYHMVTNHGKKSPFECRECGKCCPDKVKLVRHSASHNETKQLSCCFCDMVFTRQYRLNIHMNKHTGEQPYKCTECDKSFQSPRNLARHKRSHAGKSFDCDICHQVLNDKCAMLDHKARVHSGPDLMNCEECGIPFSSKMYLSVHMRNVHGFTEKDRPTMHQCSVCKKYFKTASSLISHFKTHSSAKHTCEICHKGFISAHNLQQHFRVHLSPSGELTTENYRKCTYCDKEFGSRKQLAKHMVTHTKERPHVCTVCGRQYGLKASLAKHMVSHHMSEEDIKAVLDCDVCGMRCFSTEGLEQHMSTHTLTEDHICVECGDRFMRSKDLKEHRKLMHDLQNTAGHPRTHPVPDVFRKGNLEAELQVYLPGSGIVKRNENKETGHKERCGDPISKFPRLLSEDDTVKLEKEERKNCDGSVTKFPRLSSENETIKMKSDSVTYSMKSIITCSSDRYTGNDTLHAKCTNLKAISDKHVPRSYGSISTFLDHGKHSVKYHDSEFTQNNKDVISSSDTMSDDSVMMVDHNNFKKGFILSDGKTTQTSTPCSQCNRSFATSLDLCRHVSRVHSSRTVEELPRCSLCGVCFRDEEYLQTHIKVHTAYVPVKQEKNGEEHLSLGKVDGKAYKCSVCDEMFVKSSLLESHVKVHAKEDGMGIMWRFHLVDTPESQSYVCVHVQNNTALSCHQSYDSL